MINLISIRSDQSCVEIQFFPNPEPKTMQEEYFPFSKGCSILIRIYQKSRFLCHSERSEVPPNRKESVSPNKLVRYAILQTPAPPLFAQRTTLYKRISSPPSPSPQPQPRVINIPYVVEIYSPHFLIFLCKYNLLINIEI